MPWNLSHSFGVWFAISGFEFMNSRNIEINLLTYSIINCSKSESEIISAKKSSKDCWKYMIYYVKKLSVSKCQLFSQRAKWMTGVHMRRAWVLLSAFNHNMRMSQLKRRQRVWKRRKKLHAFQSNSTGEFLTILNGYVEKFLFETITSGIPKIRMN